MACSSTSIPYSTVPLVKPDSKRLHLNPEFILNSVDLLSAKLRIATVLGGIAIAVSAAAIILAVAWYFFGTSLSVYFLSIILLVILVVDILQWLFSPYLITYAYRLTPVSEGDMNYTWLFQVIREIAQQSGIGMPRLYIAEVGFPNAFAYSSPIAGKRVAITRPLLNLLDRDELEAVLAHEMGHLRHHDIELLFAIGLIPSLIFYVAYGLLFAGSSRQQSGYAFIVAIALIIISFIFNLVILGVNRMRESYADISATIYAKDGAEHLQSALAKIVVSTGTGFRRNRARVSSSITSMLLFSDINSRSNGSYKSLLEKWRTMKVPAIYSIFSSHPHPAKRVQMLEKIRGRSF